MWKIILSWFGGLFESAIAMFVAYKSGESSAKRDIEIERLRDERKRLKEQRDAGKHVISVDDADRVWRVREETRSNK